MICPTCKEEPEQYAVIDFRQPVRIAFFGDGDFQNLTVCLHCGTVFMPGAHERRSDEKTTHPDKSATPTRGKARGRPRGRKKKTNKNS